MLSIASGNAQSGPVSTALAQPIVALVTDANGNAKAGVSITFAVTGGGGSVSLATGTTDAAGHASTAWTLGATVGAQTLDVASTGLPAVPASATGTSNPLSWVFTAQPGTSQQIAGAAVTPAVVAELRNASNAVVTSFNGSATLTLGANPGGSTLGGTATVTAVNGVATFPGLSLNKAGVGYTLAVNSTGAGAGTTTPFSVTAGAASVLSIASGSAQSGAVSAALSQPVVALVTDGNGNPKAGVSVTFAVTAGGGSVSLATSNTDTAGHASTTWTLGTLVGTQTLSAASTGLTTVPASATGISTSTALAWVFTGQPAASQVAGVVITPALVAELRNASNAVVTSFNGSATLTLGANPGGSTLGGTDTVYNSAVNGVATFSAVTLDKANLGYTVVVSSVGATSATSSAFDITAAAAANLSLQSGGAQSAYYGTVLAAPVVALVVDAFGNPRSGVSVTFAVSGGGGSVSLATGTTDAAGKVSTLWTLGTLLSPQTLSVTSTGLTTVSVSATVLIGD